MKLWSSLRVGSSERLATTVFLNRRAAARYRALASVIPGPREVLLEFVILVF